MTAFETFLHAVKQELIAALATVTDEDVNTVCVMILQARRIFIAGKGRSGLQMRGFAMRLMHIGLQAHVVDEVTTPAITADDLLIIGSGSGRTPSLIAYAQRVRQESAPMLLITGAEQSPLGDSATHSVHIAAPSPKTSQHVTRTLPMGGLFEMSLTLFLEMVIVQLMRELHVDEQAMSARHANLE